TWQTSWHRKHSMHFRNSCTRSMSSRCIRHVPSGASGGRGLNGLIFFFTRKFHETSVTKSLMTGKAFTGSIVTGFSNGNSLIRVMHISFGIPVTSAGTEPHCPPFHFAGTRTALPCLTVPSARKIRRLRALDVMHGIEHDHAFGYLGCVIPEL